MTRSAHATITAQLPHLRRYARALTGSQRLGDGEVRACLEAILAEGLPVASRHDLFRVFHSVRSERKVAPRRIDEEGATDAIEVRLRERVVALPAADREMLLLTQLEGFSAEDAATIIGIAPDAGRELLDQAWSALKHQPPTRILIIEDEPVIALDMTSIVRAMGHSVAGVASRLDVAVELAKKREPGMVLADIQLEDGSSGIDAVDTILESVDLPVVFVTAFPERLLTGERREPEFVVEKPFDPKTLEVAVAQALFCAPARSTT